MTSKANYITWKITPHQSSTSHIESSIKKQIPNKGLISGVFFLRDPKGKAVKMFLKHMRNLTTFENFNNLQDP